MAKRYQVGEFNPAKAIQPRQQITDQYIQPSYFQIPQNEFIDVARSLSGLSDSLGSMMRQQVEADTQEQRMQAGADVATMDKKQLEATIAGKWREAGLPDGADPVTQIALREHAGRKLAKTSLETYRIDNVDRLADPMSNEDPRAAMRAEFEKLGISGFYASTAAAEEFTKQSNAFAEEVLRTRASRSVKQRSDNFQDTLYSLLLEQPSQEKPSEHNAWVQEWGEVVQQYYRDTGKSGRDEVWNSLTLAAKEVANRDGEVEAIELISALAETKIGDKRLGDSFGAEMDILIDAVGDIAENAEFREARVAELHDKQLNRTVINAVSKYYLDHPNKNDINPQGNDTAKEIRGVLEKAGVSPGDMPRAITAAQEFIEGRQRSNVTKSDPEAIAAIMRVLGDPNMTTDDAMEIIKTHEDTLTDGQMAGLIEQAIKKKPVDDLIFSAQSYDTTYKILRNDLGEVLDELGSDDGELSEFMTAEMEHALYAEFSDKYYQLAAEYITDNPQASAAQVVTGIRESFRNWGASFIDGLSIREHDTTEGDVETAKFKNDPVGPTSQRLRDRIREQEQNKYLKSLPTERPDAATAAESFLEIDTPLTEELVKLQNASGDARDWDAEDWTVFLANPVLSLISQLHERSPSRWSGDRNALGSKVYKMSKAVASSPPQGPIKRGIFGMPERDAFGNYKRYSPDFKHKRNYIQARTITGFTYEEIKTRILGGTEEWVSGGYKIPDEMLNPRFIVLVDGIESLEEFNALVGTDEGKERLTKILEELPDKAIGLNNFVNLQRALFKERR